MRFWRYLLASSLNWRLTLRMPLFRRAFETSVTWLDRVAQLRSLAIKCGTTRDTSSPH